MNFGKNMIPLNKIKLQGNRAIPFSNDPPELGKEYLLSLRVEVTGVYNPAVLEEGAEPPKTYSMKVLNPEALQEVGSTKKIEIRRFGSSESQLTRHCIASVLDEHGFESSDENYAKVQEHIRRAIGKISGETLGRIINGER